MKRVLIVEDDPVVGSVYKTRLEREGYEITIATDGQSGFYLLHEFEPDAVLLDLMLPKLNGISVLKKIRAEPKFKNTPVIVFTNAYLPNTVSEAFLAGATLVFNKASVTPKEIIDALRTRSFPASIAPASAPSNKPEALGSQVDHNLREETKEASFQSNSPSGARREAEPPRHTATDVVAFAEEKEVDNSESEANLLESFLQRTPEVVASLRKTTQDFSRAPDETSRLSLLQSLFRNVHGLTGSAGMAGLRNLPKIATALEFLLQELRDKPKNLNASTMRTIAHAIDVLSELCSKGAEGDVIEPGALEILVVDDEILSRRAITFALDRAGLKSTDVGDSDVALNLAAEKSFDLIFLDVQLGVMDGFELCKRIHLLPLNKTTPVIFVTSLTDLKSRAQSSLSGGSEFIAKPFTLVELSVKALTYVLRRRPPEAASSLRTG